MTFDQFETRQHRKPHAISMNQSAQSLNTAHLMKLTLHNICHIVTYG